MVTDSNIDCFIEICNHKSIGNYVLDVFKESSPSSSSVPPLLNVIARDAELDKFYSFIKDSYELGSKLDYAAISPIASKDLPHLSNVRLPQYSWNHTTSYWSEPKMSENFRSGVERLCSASIDTYGKNILIDLAVDKYLTDHTIRVFSLPLGFAA
jgi:hypothetical protein